MFIPCLYMFIHICSEFCIYHYIISPLYWSVLCIYNAIAHRMAIWYIHDKLVYELYSRYSKRIRGGHNESSIIDAWWPNHDGVHSMTSVDHFCWKWIAVNPLHTLVLGVIQDQTVEQCKMALASGRFLQLQKLYVIICIKRIMRIIVNGIKNIFK